MISWFNRSRIRSYVKLSTRKQNKMKQEIDQRHAEQRSIMDSRLANAKDYARKADRLQARGKKAKAKDDAAAGEKEKKPKANQGGGKEVHVHVHMHE